MHCCGKCGAYVDGCRARYDLGIKEEDLLNLALGITSHVRITMLVRGEQCTHVWKKIYGRALGRSRRKQVKEILNGSDKLMPPARRAKRNLMDVEPSKFALGHPLFGHTGGVRFSRPLN